MLCASTMSRKKLEARVLSMRGSGLTGIIPQSYKPLSLLAGMLERSKASEQQESALTREKILRRSRQCHNLCVAVA